MKRFSLKLICLLFTTSVINTNQLTAQETDAVMIKKIFDQTLTKGQAYDNLRYLCKQIGHRLSGSDAMYKAENWGLATMKADSVYFQECMVPHWVRGGKEKAGYKFVSKKGEVLTMSEGAIEVLSLGNSVGTDGKELSGELVIVNNYDELEAKKDELKGKIVLYNYPFNQTFVKTFNGYGDAVRFRSGGASRASKYGASAVLVRSVSTAPDNHPHTGALRYNDSFPKIPALAIGVKDAENLANLYKNGKLMVKLTNQVKMLADTVGHNVIAEIKGSTNPEKIITIGGHLDSWDIGEGAHDDGAGIVQSMELLHIFAAIGYTPKHTIRVVLFANEENGLRGGNAYAEAAAKNNEIHIAAIESDAGGFSPRAFGGTMTDEQFKKFSGWLPLLQPYGITEMNRGGGGADIGPLQTKFKTATIGLSPDSQRYFDLHHAKTDVFEAVNKRELHLGAAAMAALVYLIDQNGF